MVFNIIKVIMDEKIGLNKETEEKYIKNLVKIGKLISMEAAKNPKIEEKIKELSSY